MKEERSQPEGPNNAAHTSVNKSLDCFFYGCIIIL